MNYYDRYGHHRLSVEHSIKKALGTEHKDIPLVKVVVVDSATHWDEDNRRRFGIRNDIKQSIVWHS